MPVERLGLCRWAEFHPAAQLHSESFGVERNGGSHARSVTVGLYFESAVQFVQSFTHTGQTDADFRTHAAQ